jgi:DNA polymerase II large subunit
LSYNIISHENYRTELEKQFNDAFLIAQQARSHGYDPEYEPESMLAADLAERVEKSVGPEGVASRIRELSKDIPREEVAFKIAEEIAQTFSKIGEEAAADQAVRTALAILGEGVTIAPIQGISSIKIKTNPDRTRYLSIYFAGPIRSAGGTEMALILVVADYIQHLMGLNKYKATEIEARRFIEELRLYEREVSRFQFKVSDKELFNAIMNIPVEVNGVQTDQVEVASFRNLPRIETNGVRGGALRVINDGLIGRTQKMVKIVEKLGISGWGWLKDFAPRTTLIEESREVMYLEDVVGGRPIFSLPSTSGGFRLRYGRARNTGLTALGIHPSTMHILGDFIATGTQLRIEKPGKAGIAAAVDSIEPPIVKLSNGSIKRVNDLELAKSISKSIVNIMFLGDILISFGEFVENNKALVPSGFVEEWWVNLLSAAIKDKNSLKKISSQPKVDRHKIDSFLNNPTLNIPTPDEAIYLSKNLSIPLHPTYTYFWDNLTADEIYQLRQGITNSKFKVNDSGELTIDELHSDVKKLLEKAIIPHELIDQKIMVPEGIILHECLGLENKWDSPDDNTLGHEYISKMSGITVLPKAPSFIGARMGRPEKAKPREMRPIVHTLFPIGFSGGPRRNIVEAAKNNTIMSIDVEKRFCSECNEFTHTNLCMKCGNKTILQHFCPKCGKTYEVKQCPQCNVETVTHEKRPVNIRSLLELATKRLDMSEPPDVVKGVRGMTSDTKKPELLEKGLLRAKHNLSMFKDGTIRFDITNAPLTHFKPVEIGLPIDRLQNLGYKYDHAGNLISNSDQLCSLMLQDIIIPESCGEYFVRVTSFIDDLLKKVYDLPSYYNIKSKDDLIGKLVVGLSPHTSVGVIARIIGFTKASVCLAHPFWHAAKRRDCDGDEDAVILLMDVLLNFSRSFLPTRIGGLMDAPLLLSLFVNPNEVARQAFNIEIVERFPLEFFLEAEKKSDSKNVIQTVPTIAGRLDTPDIYTNIGFTHFTSNINQGNLESSYKSLPSMLEKVEEQLKLADKVNAVGSREVAMKVLSTHLMRDVVGNLKAFSSQRFRCSKCNMKFRRIPLSGVCTRCKSKLYLTVHRGAIEKYLTLAQNLVKNYGIGPYYEQWLKLISGEIDSLFHDKDVERQPELMDFM